MAKTKRHFLDWVSEVSLTDVFEPGSSRLHPHQISDQGVLYLGSVRRADSDKLRSALKLANSDGEDLDVLPEPYDLHSDIHEYGGRPFWVSNDTVLFLNRDDKCVYRARIEGYRFTAPERVSPCLGGIDDASAVSLSDVCLVNEQLCIAIAEIHESVDQSPENSSQEPKAGIVLWRLDAPDEPLQLIQEGADFYSNLSFDPNFSRLAWVEWQHPNMPWDSNSLVLAQLECNKGLGKVVKAQRANPLDTGSYCQLVFNRIGELFCAVDFANAGELNREIDDNYWNVYKVDLASLELERISQGTREFGYPHWQFGDCRLCAGGQQFLLGIASDPEGDALWVYDQINGRQQYVQSRGSLSSLTVNEDGQGAVIEMPFDAPPKTVLFSLTSDGQVHSDLTENLAESLESGRADADSKIFNSVMNPQSAIVPIKVSVAQHIEYPTRDGAIAYAHYYAPANRHFECDQLPPVIVMVHGGPTARAYGHFDLQKQFWTSNGFAVVDVNHRGSSGYGRNYRDALYGHWGDLDCDDIIDAIDSLAERKKIDPRAVCIRGKSAGGYAVLRALTQYPDRFSAGASYYGIGDLATLAEITHKFEKHYTDRLIGEPYDPNTATQPDSRYVTRSPIHYVSRVNTPMAIFQGSLDKVVPPRLAHDFVAALQARGVQYSYHEFPDEAHGFKNPSNNIKAWTVELDFYRANLRPIMLTEQIQCQSLVLLNYTKATHFSN